MSNTGGSTNLDFNGKKYISFTASSNKACVLFTGIFHWIPLELQSFTCRVFGGKQREAVTDATHHGGNGSCNGRGTSWRENNFEKAVTDAAHYGGKQLEAVTDVIHN